MLSKKEVQEIDGKIEENKDKNINWAEVEKKEKERERKEFIDKIKNKYKGTIDYASFCEDLVNEQGIYFDSAKIWWLWDNESYAWKIVDETDIMIIVDSILNNSGTLETKLKNIIIEGLKRYGRLKSPIPLENTQIQFKNKIVNYETGEEIEATHKYFSVNPIPHKLGDSEETPILDKFLNDWVGEKSYLLKEILAYSLSNTYFIQRIFCLIGSGANGKTTFLDLISRYLGKENVVGSSLDLIISNRFETANLYKKLVCLMGETNFGTLSKTEMLKKLCGGDLIRGEFKGKGSFSYTNYAKIIISTNSLPPTTDKTRGFYRRWTIVEFSNIFEEKFDVLAQIPEKEYENLAKFSIKLLKNMRKKGGFEKEENIEEKRKRYESFSNPVNKFIEEYYEKDISSHTSSSDFLEDCNNYLEENNKRTINAKELKKILTSLGYEYKKINTKNTSYTAIIGLRSKESKKSKDIYSISTHREGMKVLTFPTFLTGEKKQELSIGTDRDTSKTTKQQALSSFSTGENTNTEQKASNLSQDTEAIKRENELRAKQKEIFTERLAQMSIEDLEALEPAKYPYPDIVFKCKYAEIRKRRGE